MHMNTFLYMHTCIHVLIELVLFNLHACYSFDSLLSFFSCDFILSRGYIEAIREIEQQLQTAKERFDDIVVACGRFYS